MQFSYAPVTKRNWIDLETLFGPNGACAGCWCMLWRTSKKAYEAGKGESNKATLKALATGTISPGIVVYEQSNPIAWCSLGSREKFPGLTRSRILKPVDDRPVWSITCLFVKKEWRSKGVSVATLGFAKDFAKGNGAVILEGYPIEPKTERMPDVFAWTGISHAYSKAGFEEVARRSETRPIMRIEL